MQIRVMELGLELRLNTLKACVKFQLNIPSDFREKDKTLNFNIDAARQATP